MNLTEHQRNVLMDFLNCTYVNTITEEAIGMDYSYDSVVINEVLEEVWRMLKDVSLCPEVPQKLTK